MKKHIKVFAIMLVAIMSLFVFAGCVKTGVDNQEQENKPPVEVPDKTPSDKEPPIEVPDEPALPGPNGVVDIQVNEDYKLVYVDEFDTESINPDWRVEQYPRRGAYWHPDQVFLEDGNLVLRTEYRENGPNGAAWYSGGVANRKLATEPFGIYDIRFKTPINPGHWEAIWIMQDISDTTDFARNGAEIDIIELFNPKIFQYNVHCDNYGNHRGGIGKSDNLSNVWHTVTIDWQPDYIKFYFDRKKIGAITDERFISQVDTSAEFLITTEVNGVVENGVPVPSDKGWGGVGVIDSNGKDYKADFRIDYVKRYTRTSSSAK